MVVAAGVETQEYTYLSFERAQGADPPTIEYVDGRVPVMVGISHPSFRTAIELAHDAEKLGAAAVQLLAPLRPFAGPPTQADLIAYFEAIGARDPAADHALPQSRAGRRRLDSGTIALAKLPRVQLIKESSRDLARVSRLIVEIDRAGHAQYFTTMQMLLATLELGGSGATMPPPARDRAPRDRRLRGQGLRTRRRVAAPVRAVSREMDASRPRAGDEGGDEPDRRAGRRALSALWPVTATSMAALEALLRTTVLAGAP